MITLNEQLSLYRNIYKIEDLEDKALEIIIYISKENYHTYLIKPFNDFILIAMRSINKDTNPNKVVEFISSLQNLISNPKHKDFYKKVNNKNLSDRIDKCMKNNNIYIPANITDIEHIHTLKANDNKSINDYLQSVKDLIMKNLDLQRINKKLQEDIINTYDGPIFNTAHKVLFVTSNNLINTSIFNTLETLCKISNNLEHRIFYARMIAKYKPSHVNSTLNPHLEE